MGNNILFIVPPILPLNDLKHTIESGYQHYVSTSPPLGIMSMIAYYNLYVSAQSKIIDINIEIIKNNKLLLSSENYLKELMHKILSIDGYPPDIVGISAIFNSHAGYLSTISKIIKEVWPNVIVVAGGGLPTNMYKNILSECAEIDALLVGEGEIPFLNLILSNDRKSFLENSEEWVTQNNYKEKSPRPVFIQDLDEIPLLPYQMINLLDYQSKSRYHGDINDDAIVMPLMTSRGCPYNCVFCSSYTIHGKKFRYASANRIIEDIKYLVENYKVNTILIEDDHFLYNKRRAIDILDGISEMKLNIEFTSGLVLAALDEDIIQSMKKAGVRSATLAIESGSDRVLREIIKKPLKLSMVSGVVNLLRKYEIYIRAFFIIGFPGETIDEIYNSINFMKETGFNWVAIMIATPIAGSRLYKICKENNYLVSDSIEDYHYGKGNIITKDFTPAEIEKIRYNANLEVNFIDNYDLKHNKPDIAIVGFHDVIHRVQDHAFAHYFASKCYHDLGHSEKAIFHQEKYYSIINKSSVWKDHAKRFGLPLS